MDATLTLRSPTVAASDMSRRLAIEPDHSWEPGDSLARRRSPRMRRTDHGWAVRAEAADAAGAVTGLRTRLERGVDAIGCLLSEGGTRIDLVVFTFDSAATSEAGSLDAGVARLAEAFGTDLVVTGEMGAGTSRVRTWTTAPKPRRGDARRVHNPEKVPTSF